MRQEVYKSIRTFNQILNKIHVDYIIFPDPTGDTEEATEVAMEVMAMEDMVMAITESFSPSAQLRVQQVNWIPLHWRR